MSSSSCFFFVEYHLTLFQCVVKRLSILRCSRGPLQRRHPSCDDNNQHTPSLPELCMYNLPPSGSGGDCNNVKKILFSVETLALIDGFLLARQMLYFFPCSTLSLFLFSVLLWITFQGWCCRYYFELPSKFGNSTCSKLVTSISTLHTIFILNGVTQVIG